MAALKTEYTVDGMEYVASTVQSGICKGCAAQGADEESIMLCRMLPVCHSYHKQPELSEFIIWIKKEN